MVPKPELHTVGELQVAATSGWQEQGSAPAHAHQCKGTGERHQVGWLHGKAHELHVRQSAKA